MLLEYLSQTYTIFKPINNAPNDVFLSVAQMQVIDSQGIF